ncbi:MAG: putative RND superfamily exporter protein [Flavobacteriaceae bacterium]|jgi:predicted RND superfamily exporter protein
MDLKESNFRKYRWISLVLIVGLTVLFGANMSNTKFEFNFEKLFPADDAETAYFNEFRNKFSPENDQLPIIIQRNSGVFNLSFFKKIDRLTKRIERIENVNYVVSLTNQAENLIDADGAVIQKPYIDLSDFSPSRDSAGIVENVELVKSLISEDAKSICMFVKYEDYLPVKESSKLVKNVQNEIDKYAFDDVRMFGKAFGQDYIIKTMSSEMKFFLSISALLVVLFLLIIFRSVWGILIPQIVLFLTLIWLIGTLGLFDEKINILLTVMPTIMFVVSMSDVIHLVSSYLDVLKDSKDNFAAIRIAIKEVAFATMLTSITTAIGFFSLYIVPIQPIQSFGIIMGVGVLFAFTLTFGLLPILFYWFPGRVGKNKVKRADFWPNKLSASLIYVLRRRKSVLVVAGVIAIVSIIGALSLNSNNYLMDDLTPNDPFAKDLKYIDENYGGTRSFVMTVELADDNDEFWELENLREIDTIQTYLEKEYNVKIRSSLIDAIKILNRGMHGGKTNEYRLPETPERLAPLKKIIETGEDGRTIRNFIDSIGTTLQLVGFIGDEGRDNVSLKNIKLDEFLASQDNQRFKTKITGTAHLLDKNMGYLVYSMLLGLGISVLMVALIMGIVFKSIKMAFLSLIPNLIPLVIIGGIMGYMGIELKMSNVLIFSIAFGIVVDDTIHFLGKFNIELQRGSSSLYALKRSYLTTGKAMILTTAVLCSGFIIMIFSSFMGTFYLGFLLSSVLFIALLADLTLLPILLALFYKKPKSDKQ